MLYVIKFYHIISDNDTLAHQNGYSYKKVIGANKSLEDKEKRKELGCLD